MWIRQVEIAFPAVCPAAAAAASKRAVITQNKPVTARHPRAWLAGLRGAWRRPVPAGLRKYLVLLLYVLAAVQFIGSYIYLEWSYVNVPLWERGYAPLPFQTRLLLAPLYRYIDTAPWSVQLADRMSRANPYFFPHGLAANEMLEFLLGIACVLFSGWVALRLYDAGTRQGLLRPLVYPVFLLICVVLYIVHTVQNFRYVYDMPSLACFAAGFYLIYFRKPLVWFVLLFAVGTLNRETTLLLLPFWTLTQALDPGNRLVWQRIFRLRVVAVVLPLFAYWLAWHHLVYRIFATNASEYYPRFLYNLNLFQRLRYWPQLAAAFAYLWPLLLLHWRRVSDPQLRAWMMVLPLWYGLMMFWAILTETRIFGELAPFLAPVTVILAEELVLAAAHRRGLLGGSCSTAMRRAA